MSTFTAILLIIIFVLIVSDVFFLWKIYKNIDKKKKGLPDEKYFELKYNINLLKAVSAILIFLIGFLGFTAYGDIINKVEEDFSGRFSEQNSRIDSLSQILTSYEKFVDSLKSETDESVENLGDINRKLQTINTKLSKNQEALKYTPQIYVVNSIEYDRKSGRETKMGEGLKFFYKNLKTIYGEKLPKFKLAPLINLQGDGAEFVVIKNTPEYFEISLYVSDGLAQEENKVKFNIWLISLNQ